MKQTLLPFCEWVEPTLVVADGDQLLTFTIQDAFNYHGYGAISGVVLGFRLLQKAAELLTDQNKLLQRRELSLFTAFPGLGVRDCLELITRMVTENRIIIDSDFNEIKTQEGVNGHFYFRLDYQGKQVTLAPIESYPPKDSAKIALATKQPNASNEILEQWRQERFKLANILLASHYRNVIRVI